MRKLALVVTAALLACPAALAGLPGTGTLVPGRSLAGIRLGETQQQVRGALGRSYGLCTNCRRTTWYFNLRPFDQHGLGVEFTRGRVSAVYTIWGPAGWRGPKGLVLGDAEAQVTAAASPLFLVSCTGYDAWVADHGTTRTAYYILDGDLWGFGLLERNANPCR
jgi:hypothetical protein